MLHLFFIIVIFHCKLLFFFFLSLIWQFSILNSKKTLQQKFRFDIKIEHKCICDLCSRMPSERQLKQKTKTNRRMFIFFICLVSFHIIIISSFLEFEANHKCLCPCVPFIHILRSIIMHNNEFILFLRIWCTIFEIGF